MDAQNYVDELHTKGSIVRLASFDSAGWCNGRGLAIVLDHKESMAMMLENCGRAEQTNLRQGAIVKFRDQPGGEPRIVGQPAYC